MYCHCTSYSFVDWLLINRAINVNFHLLFKKIGIVVDPLVDLDVCADDSSSSIMPLITLMLVARGVLVDDDDDNRSLFFGILLLIVETFPPLLIRLLFGPTIPEKSTFGGGIVEFMIGCCLFVRCSCCRYNTYGCICSVVFRNQIMWEDVAFQSIQISYVLDWTCVVVNVFFTVSEK